MVIVQPVCCNQARCTTTNSEYGNFYVSVFKEHVQSRQSEPVHKECAKNADALSKELNDVKSKLECLQQYQGGPCPKTGILFPPGGDINLNLFSPKNGKCFCASGPGPPDPHLYKSVYKYEFSGPREHDAEALQQHIRKEHPRLVKRNPPPKTYSAPCITGTGRGDHCPSLQPEKEVCEDNNMYIKFTGRGGSRCNSAGSNNNECKPRPSNDQCYNFYKYYGYGGQGARTSKGWHFKVKV